MCVGVSVASYMGACMHVCMCVYNYPNRMHAITYNGI